MSRSGLTWIISLRRKGAHKKMNTPNIFCNLPTVDMLPEAEQALRKHGCTVEMCRSYTHVVFPPGTFREADMIYAPAASEPRHVLSLPSGIQIIQIELRNREGFRDRYGDLQMSQLLIPKRECQQIAECAKECICMASP